ncbi:MerR family transcriptional regulator [Paenibacillus donghaensis]|uniref:MerR family transcriptional regulator n=1 Tax=Paenibacillus donghaensis TaxID=414771 RepID=A0A2Z2KTP2_9BACL|nr:MerR family transcriptional regulator [Paenibacillus donghaensis]
MDTEYTVQKLGKLAGVSTRTLRYYDEFGLLKPARINSSGYRIYGQAEVDRLQQILFYRELGLGLESIRGMVTSPSFDGATALREHHEQLLQRRTQLDLLIATVEQTLAHTEGRMIMSNADKFTGFKQKMVDDNEQKYGAEIRDKYGDDVVNESNRQMLGMTEAQYADMQKVEQDMLQLLEQAIQTGDPASEPAQQAADLHRQWLGFSWSSYSKEAHAGVAEMYVADERFTAYYDKHAPGMAEFLRDAVLIYTSTQK